MPASTNTKCRRRSSCSDAVNDQKVTQLCVIVTQGEMVFAAIDSLTDQMNSTDAEDAVESLRTHYQEVLIILLSRCFPLSYGRCERRRAS